MANEEISLTLSSKMKFSTVLNKVERLLWGSTAREMRSGEHSQPRRKKKAQRKGFGPRV